MRLAVQTEKNLAHQIARYLQVMYPDVLYRFDIAADLKLTVGQASKHRALHPHRGHPDLFIFKPVGKKYGMAIELKREGTRVYLKNGNLSTDEHIQEQSAYLQKLADLGYQASFAIGYDEAVKQIDSYLKG